MKWMDLQPASPAETSENTEVPPATQLYDPFPGTVPLTGTPVPAIDLATKTAICQRVMAALGQKWLPPQPTVIPLWKRASINS